MAVWWLAQHQGGVARGGSDQAFDAHLFRVQFHRQAVWPGQELAGGVNGETAVGAVLDVAVQAQVAPTPGQQQLFLGLDADRRP